jgi:hypothetical protein
MFKRHRSHLLQNISPSLAGGDEGEGENNFLFTLTPAYQQAGIADESKKIPFGQRSISLPKGYP